jgi:hypothetical protein
LSCKTEHDSEYQSVNNQPTSEQTDHPQPDPYFITKGIKNLRHIPPNLRFLDPEEASEPCFKPKTARARKPYTSGIAAVQLGLLPNWKACLIDGVKAR